MSVAILGAGALGRIVANILALNHCDIFGFFDDDESKLGNLIDGIKVRDTIESVTKLDRSVSLIIGIGDVNVRKQLYERFLGEGFVFAKAIHPTASIAISTTLAEGVIVKDCAVIEPGAKVEANTIIGNSSIVCHDAKIGKHCRLAPSVTIAGHVTIEDGCYLGVKVSVDRTKRVGTFSTIASGCTIWEDVPSHSFVKLPKAMKTEAR